MIPRFLHFVQDTARSAFSFTDYVAIKSAAMLHPGHQVHFYVESTPEGIYWDIARPYVHEVHLGTRIADPLLHGIAQLQRQGGVLLRLDTITLCSFDDLLDHHAAFGSDGAVDGAALIGTAVILSEPGSEVLTRLSGMIAARLPLRADQLVSATDDEAIAVLPVEAFHSIGNDAKGCRDLLIEDLQFPAARVLPLWFPLGWPLARKLDERNVAFVDSTYSRLARRVIDDDLPRFAQARQQELAAKCVPPIRVNLGCGANKREGWLNVDTQPASSPDLVFDISVAPWPLPDNSVGEAELSHVLEHVGDRFETVIKELHRTCRADARVHIAVPHPRHEWYLADPTHSRPLVPLSFQMLDAEWCKSGLLEGQTATPLAVYWQVDFELVSAVLQESPDLLRLPRRRLLWSLGYPFMVEWRERLTRFAKHLVRRPVSSVDFSARRVAFLARHLNNMVGQMQIELRVRKPTAPLAGTPKSNPLGPARH